MPTLIEEGIPEFDISAWFGLAVPIGLPADVLTRLEFALDAVAKDPEIVPLMEKAGAEVGFLGSQDMGHFMNADAAKWKRVATFAKIKLD